MTDADISCRTDATIETWVRESL